MDNLFLSLSEVWNPGTGCVCTAV